MMGRNNHKKSNKKAADVPTKKVNKGLSSLKRNEVNEIVKKLLNLASTCHPNVKLNWENHLEIDKLLKKVQEIEPVMNTVHLREKSFPKLVVWVKEHGGMIDNVSITKFEGMDYGLEATKDLKEGEMICAIPRKVMMTIEDINDSPLAYLYANDPILKYMENITLALFLIVEYLKGKNSFWFPYISSLPTSYNTVLYFTSDDLLELKCSPTFEPAINQCRNIARQYAYFNKLFQSSNDEASLVLRNTFTYELYRWAVSTVMTRQNFIPAKADGISPITALIPYWDMCNHTNGYLSTDYETDRMECMACKPFRKGDQVFIFYGMRPNSHFLVHNGFVYENNENDTFQLRLGISKADKLHNLKCELLHELGLSGSEDFYIRAGPEPIEEHLLCFMRIFNMEKDDLEHWKESMNLKDLLRKDCKLDSKIEAKVWNFLSDRINLLLTIYNKNDEASQDSNVSESRKLIRFQLSLEIKFLKTTLEYVQQQITVHASNQSPEIRSP